MVFVGDIIFLPNKRLIKVNAIYIKKKAVISSYSVMTLNLEFGKREGDFKVEDGLILKELSSKQYHEYKKKSG